MTQRIDFEEGLDLFTNTSLSELKKQASAIRQSKNPGNRVTFVLDSNPNYTNICSSRCTFCPFYREKDAPDCYTKTVDQVLEHFKIAEKQGLSTVLLQGGLNDDLNIHYYTEIISRARSEYPSIHPHLFSAPEVAACAKASNLTIKETLKTLWDAGLRTIPGAGAEILSERIRKQISPKKIDCTLWLAIHKMAHNIGFRTTATMMYGHIEEPQDILIHLQALRDLQDKTKGFTAFIPWSFKGANTALGQRVKKQAGREEYLRIIAFSRIFLDNFDHIQATWFSEGKETGIESLQYGADDFGGIIAEENVHKAANFINTTSENGIISMIQKAGFEPVERDTLYRMRVRPET